MALLAPLAALEKLKCSVCSNCLFHFPIRLSSDNEPICGRCPLHETGSYLRNDVYESLAEFLQFPCRYNESGCSEVLVPHLIPDHEKTCVFKPLDCPTKSFTSCCWLGNSLDRVSHCVDSHSDLILKNGEFVIEPISSTHFNIVHFENDLIIMKGEFDNDTKIFKFCVVSVLQEEKRDKYIAQVTLGDNNDISAKFSFHNGVSKKPNSTAIGLESLQLDAKNYIRGTIKVADVDKGTNELLPTKWCNDVISQFKCPDCLHYLSNPKMCRFCHIACTNCYSWCLSCQESGHRESFSLDVPFLQKVAEAIVVPCSYADAGCKVKDGLSNIIVHEESCPYKPHPCPFIVESCRWEGPRVHLLSHVNDSHSTESGMTTDTFTILNYDANVDMVNTLKFSNHVFVLRCRSFDSGLIWSVLLISKHQPEVKFKFEVELVDKTGQGQRFCMSRHCGVWFDGNQELTSNEELKIWRAQFQHIMTKDNSLTYRIRIFK